MWFSNGKGSEAYSVTLSRFETPQFALSCGDLSHKGGLWLRQWEKVNFSELREPWTADTFQESDCVEENKPTWRKNLICTQ